LPASRFFYIPPVPAPRRQKWPAVAAQSEKGAVPQDAGAGGRKRKQFAESLPESALDVLWGKQTDDGDWTG